MGCLGSGYWPLAHQVPGFESGEMFKVRYRLNGYRQFYNIKDKGAMQIFKTRQPDNKKIQATKFIPTCARFYWV
jgi:hypothetical protein